MADAGDPKKMPAEVDAQPAVKTVTEQIYLGSFGVLGALMLVSNVFAFPVLMQMISYTVILIFIGCHQSLNLLKTTDEKGEKINKGDVEVVSSDDAKMFPIVGSGALLSLYVAYKWLGQWWVNILLTCYLTFLGVLAMGATFTPLVQAWLSPSLRTRNLKSINFLLPVFLAGEKESDRRVKFDVTLALVLANSVAIQIGIVFLWTRNWMAHNIFGSCFCIQAMNFVSLGKFKTGFFLLIGLFFYDIFWVFGTDVMVTFAKSFDAPAKLVFPVSINPWKTSILGLGDIVVPGLFIALNLRFDTTRAGFDFSKASSTWQLKDFSKPYFTATMVMYVLALVVTGLIMLLTEHAQPALLYLVPGIMSGTLGTAFIRGEFKELMQYDEGSMAGNDDETSEDDSKKGESKKDS